MTTTTQPADLLALQRLSDACLSRRLTPDECSEFQAAIESLAAHRGEVEPVAWMVSKDGYHHFGTYRSVRDHAALDRDFKAGRLRLLYLHPPQAQADPDEEMATNVWKRIEAYMRGYEDGKLDATQAQAGAGDALEDAMLAKAYRQESAAFSADSEISVGTKIERRYRELLAAALEARHEPE